MTCPINYNLEQCSSSEYGLTCETCWHTLKQSAKEEDKMDNSERHDLAIRELGKRIDRGEGSDMDLMLAGLIVNFGELRDNLKNLNDAFIKHSKLTNSSFKTFQELLGDSKERAEELLELTKKQMEACEKNCK